MGTHPKPPRPELKTLASRLLRLRQDRELTGADVARAGGLSAAQYLKIEGGHDEPGYLTLVAIANGLGVEPAALLSDGYSLDAPLAQRRAATTWADLERAAETFRTLAKEMRAYEDALIRRRSAPAPSPRRRRASR